MGAVAGQTRGQARFQRCGVAGSLAAGVVLLVIFIFVERRRGRGAMMPLALVGGLFARRLIS